MSGIENNQRMNKSKTQSMNAHSAALPSLDKSSLHACIEGQSAHLASAAPLVTFT